MRHAIAITIFTRDLNRDWNFCNRLNPVFRGRACVVARPAGKDQHAIDVFEHLVSLIPKQLWRDRLNVFERIGDCAWLLENFFLHVVTIGSEFGRTRMYMYGIDLALDSLARLVHDPDVAQLQIRHITIFEIDNLICCTG